MHENTKPIIKITGTGFYVPDKILTNFDLEKMVDTPGEQEFQLHPSQLPEGFITFR
jgi:hypothetical protein